MSIKRMLLLASMALAAIAFAAPAVAQADVTLTENGVPLEPGVEVTATSSNLKTTTEGGTLECAKVTLHFEVVNNGHEHVELQQIGEAGTSDCVLNVPEVGVFSTTVADGTVGIGEEGGLLTINTWGTGVTNATFTSTSFAGPHVPEAIVAHCHFTGPVHLQGTNETDTLHVDGDLKSTGEESCPSEAGNIHGTFTLETSDDPETPEVTEEEPVEIDFVETS